MSAKTFFIILIIVAIIAVVVTCVIALKFRKINHSMFRSHFNANVEDMDTILIYISIIGGALLGIIAFLNDRNHGDIEPLVILGIACFLLAIILSASIFQSMLYTTDRKVIRKKSLFMLSMSTLTFITSAIAGIVVMIVVMLILALVIVSFVVLGLFNKEVINVGGFSKLVSKLGNGRYEDEDGNIYEETEGY